VAPTARLASPWARRSIRGAGRDGLKSSTPPVPPSKALMLAGAHYLRPNSARGAC
jgi:hypothetical protein